jgi:hypothetical protein
VRGVPSGHAQDELVVCAQLGLDFIVVVEVAGQGRVYLRQGELGQGLDDVVNALPWYTCLETISETLTRVPLMCGRPPQTSGSTSTYCAGIWSLLAASMATKMYHAEGPTSVRPVRQCN